MAILYIVDAGYPLRVHHPRQQPVLLIVTGEAATDQKGLARELEAQLFEEGRLVYFLGTGNVRQGVDAEVPHGQSQRREHFRRLAEVANILLDAGMIVIVSAAELTQDDMHVLRTGVPPALVRTVWVGDRVTTDIPHDAVLTDEEQRRLGRNALRALVERQGFVAGLAVEPPPSAAVVWLTGLPGAGKTTIARAVRERLQRIGARVELLDGDEIRSVFPNVGFSRADRDSHIRRVGHLASRLEHHGVTSLVSLVSPYRESRDFVRGLCRKFIEVYVSTPLEECERRDPKGLYRMARSGEVTRLTGVGDPYEPPTMPELTIDTHTVALERAVEQILESLRRDGQA